MLPASADVVIIGGGVNGCSTAYHLARKGVRKVVLLEKSYLASGGTGRSAAGIRHQFGTEINIRMATESIWMLEHLKEETGYWGDIELSQGGYLMVAYTQSQKAQLEKNIALQNSLGIKSRFISTAEVREIVPAMNLEGVIGASFYERDGHANPWHVTQAYAEGAKRLGAGIFTYTEVTGITLSGGKVTAVVTPRGTIRTEKIVNVAGPHGLLVGRMVGLELPITVERHQILVTEPVAPMIRPMIISFDYGTYCKQTPHGSIVMGIGDPHELKGFHFHSSWQFLDEMSRQVVRFLPALKNVRVVRQWAGLYDITPDSQPILGPVPSVGGFYNCVGFSGHGFMLGPVIGKMMADVICGEKPPLALQVLDLGRFERNELIIEPACV